MAKSQLLKQFETHQIDAASFGHRQHVEVAFEILDYYDYLQASAMYSEAINTIAKAAGAPEKFHVTITLAFLSVIAERKSLSPGATLEEFLAAHPDLLDKGLLHRWYSPERLDSDAARTGFVLPDRAANG